MIILRQKSFAKISKGDIDKVNESAKSLLKSVRKDIRKKPIKKYDMVKLDSNKSSEVKISKTPSPERDNPIINFD